MKDRQMRTKRRIILTHWNAGVFSAKTLSQVLPELVVYALMYDEVLIREEDLLTNHPITSLLSDPDNLRFFEELLATGAVKLLRLPVQEYPTGRQFDPTRLPITARAEEHELRRTFKGRPWRPTAKEKRLFGRLDRVVSDHESASRFHRPFPEGNPFADELAEVLENRDVYGLASVPSFRQIDPHTADAFIRFCREPGAWLRFLQDAGVRTPITGPDAGFFRSAAYQCSKLLPTPSRMQHLVESAYAATYCDREASEGRYGGRLVELPVNRRVRQSGDWVDDIMVRVAAAPTSAAVSICIDPRTAAVVALTRESDAFEQLQRTLAQLGQLVPDGPLLSETAFRHGWSNLCDVYGDHYAKALVASSPGSTQALKYSVWVYLLARVVGYIVVRDGPMGLHGAPVVDHAVEHYGPVLLNAFRVLWQAPRARDTLVASAGIRSSRVLLNSRPRMR